MDLLTVLMLLWLLLVIYIFWLSERLREKEKSGGTNK